jgi:hypothetical protein
MGISLGEMNNENGWRTAREINYLHVIVEFFLAIDMTDKC